MNYDKFGQAYTTEAELFDLLYTDPTLDLSKFTVVDHLRYNGSVSETYADMPLVKPYVQWNPKMEIESFDKHNQQSWNMPKEYQDLDIAQWVLDQCKTDVELQRVGEELLLFMDRDALDLLRYMKYMVDTFRKNNIVWGLGRGSSVASYVLYLIGVHKIDSIYYDLPINEFLK